MASNKKLPGWDYADDTDLGADASMLSGESLDTVRKAKEAWQQAYETGDQAGMDHWHSVAEGERAKAGYSGGANGGGYIPVDTTPAAPDYGKAPTKYQDAMDAAIQTLQRRAAFTYDPETDPNYQQYKDQYTRLGKQAMEDTYGQAALRTGGLGGSAAVSAGQQAYNGYMAALADKIPELRQLAYQMYQDEEDRLRQDIDLYSGLDQRAWDRWNTDRTFTRGAYETDRAFDWQKAADKWTMARQLDRDRAEDTETEYQHGRDAISDKRYEDETAYQRGSAAAELLASAGDYSRWAELLGLSPEQTQALVDKYAEEEKLTRDAAARELADWYAGYGDLSKVRALGVTPQVALRTSGGGSSGGSSGGSRRTSGNSGGGSSSGGVLSEEDIYRTIQAAGGDANLYIDRNYKNFGLTVAGIPDLKAGYQNWLKAQNEAAAPARDWASITAGMTPNQIKAKAAEVLSNGEWIPTAEEMGQGDALNQFQLRQYVSDAVRHNAHADAAAKIEQSLNAGYIDEAEADVQLRRLGY